MNSRLPARVGNASHSARRILIIGVIIALASFAAVGSISAPTVRAAGTPAPAYDVFTGSVDDFYQVPTPLPTGAPGQLIRVQDVSANATSVTKRIMYHSIDGANHDRAVTGTITYPTAAPPVGGWPTVSIANGTVGMASQCALSRNSNSVYTFGLDAVGVASDYIGLGPVGEILPYLSRASEAHSVLDAVRAARNLAASGAGTRFVVLGGSQGGHGALSANELASHYSPELSLLGTVALAPAAIFDKFYGPIDQLVSRVVGAMGFYGIATEHPELNLADYVSPAGLVAMESMRTGCRDAIISTVLSVPPDEFYIHDPLLTEPARSIMLANDVGNVKSKSPVLLVQGTADNTVVPARTHDLLARMCRVGQVVRYDEVPGADHVTVTNMHLSEIQAWLADRVAGLPATTSCAKPPSESTTTTTTTTIVSGVPEPGNSEPTVTSPAPIVGATAATTSAMPTPLQVAATPSATAAAGPTRLPATGSSAVQTGLLGLVLAMSGACIVGAARRRRTT